MEMKKGIEWETSHTRMIMRKDVKINCEGILVLLKLMLNGEWWINLMI